MMKSFQSLFFPQFFHHLWMNFRVFDPIARQLLIGVRQLLINVPIHLQSKPEILINVN